MRSKVILAIVVLSGILLMGGHLQAADQLHRNFTVPVTFSGTIETTGCAALPGPQVSVQGSLAQPGLIAEVIFTDPSGAPGQQEKTPVSQEVVPANQPVVIAEQSVVGPVSANPYIWLQLTEENGKPLTSEIFLGRCDQAQFSATASLQAPMRAIADVTASACESGAPAVALDGQTELLPINGKLIFRDTDQATGPKGFIVEGVVEVAMLPTGQAYPFPQQEVSAATSVNPLISLQLRQADNEAIGSEIRLGRCKALQQ